MAIIDDAPRQWQKEDIELIKELTGRIWTKLEKGRAEEALSSSEERLRQAMQSAQMGAWEWNVGANTITWDEQSYEMIGLPAGNGAKPFDYFSRLVHPDDGERVMKALQNAAAIAGNFREEFRFVNPETQEVIWVLSHGSAIAQKEGRATRIIGVMHSINSRKRLEQQREDFLGFASHELKTPVTSIKAYTQLLLQLFEASDDTRSAGMMQKLDKQVNRLTNLINDLLDTTKIAEGQLPLHVSDFDLNDLLHERTEELQRLSATHQLVMDLCDNATFTADKERIGQVITNLVSNAIKYSPQGKQVIIRCQRIANELTISVQDFGIGIPEDVQRKVFDRFFRVKETQVQNFPGLGLGLYISAGIVHRHGGKIWVESKVGEGATFYFTLPVEK